MVRSLWLGAVASCVFLGSACNCSNVPFVDDAGTGGGNAAGGGTAAAGGGTAAGGNTGQGGGAVSTGGGTTSAGGGTTAAGGGTTAAGGGTTAAGGGTTASGGGTTAAGGGTTSAGGGMAGSGGGTVMTCTGTATNAYVCQTCTGAADTNTGTQDCPLLTIAKGISTASTLALPTVFIASTFQGGTPLTYAEDLTVPDGVTLQGKWAVTGSAMNLAWARTAGRTAIQDMLPEGLRFAASASATAGIDGLAVSVAKVGSTPVAAMFGINVGPASPTLVDFSVVGTTGQGAVPVTEFGVSVIGTGNVRTAPHIGAASINSSIGSIRSSSLSEGLHIEKAAAVVNNVFITEVAGTVLSVATRLVDAPGTTFTTGRSNTLSGATCFGVFATGDSSGVVFDAVNANGCGNTGGTSSSVFSAGVAFDNCPAVSPGTTAPVFKNSTTVTGGAVSPSPSGNTTAIAVGVLATDGCKLLVQGNTSITGATAGSSALSSAFGVLCSYQGVTNKTGLDSQCSILSNTAITGSVANVGSSVGIACDGTCGSTNANCSGSCAEIADNKPLQGGVAVTAGNGTLQYGLLVTESSPLVHRNSFGSAASLASGSSSCTNGWGAVLQGAGGVYENNLIAGPDCSGNNSSSVGLQLNAEQRKGDNSIASPLVHSNTILSMIGGGGVINPPTNQAAVLLNALTTGGSQATVGSFFNNVFQIGPLSALGANAVFSESNTKVDPVAVQYNDFFIVSSGVVMLNPPLYFDEGTTVLSTVAAINGLMDTSASNNVSVNPTFVGGSLPHIQNTSPLKALGTGSGNGPADDYDGQMRPNPANTAPDIGADEVGG